MSFHCSFFKGRVTNPELFGVEALAYIEAASAGQLASVRTLDDNKYIFIDTDLTTESSPYNALLKSARFGTKGEG